MGRPRKNEDLLLKKHVLIRYTEKEYMKLKKMYDKTPYPSLSAFLRVLTLNPKFITSFLTAPDIQEKEKKEFFKEIKRQVAAIGNNINQIAKVVNSQKFARKTDIGGVIIELNKIRQLLSQLEHDS